jgi:mannose-1-phosphate guanylyltransferase/mannose-6-phosphate isomerase
MPVIFPVIMCGGSGTRLWPASRPSRPKQFIPLSGNRSLFQETVERVIDLAGSEGRLIVIGGAAHRQTICEQLKELGRDATILLEPEARESAAAMAAAAIWTMRQHPDAVNLFVASDHHIPDGDAFRASVLTASEAAHAGRIVTFGVVPSGPSSAYGYIAPRGEGLAEVKAFVEKPDLVTAQRYIAEGYLWNSGNFVVRADVLQDELRQTTAGLIEAVSDALDSSLSDGGAMLLGRRFCDAPKISIDYAVMEKTRRAAVLPVAFDWSDLGAWDAVHRSGEGDVGLHVFEDAENCLVRACDGVLVAAVGVSDLAIVVERDAVLVTDLARSQDVRKIVSRLEGLSPRHLDFPQTPQETLEQGATRFAAWMRQTALPTWCTLGQNAEGGFDELLAQDGRRLPASRRAVVQARQLQVYSAAGRLGWSGPWSAVVASGLAWTRQRLMKADGRIRTRTSFSGAREDDTTTIYDQAFLLFAMADISITMPAAGVEDQAAQIRDQLVASMDAGGGVVESGDHPYQANAHMHLLEAALAWEDARGDSSWAGLSDRIVALAQRQFIDADTGMIREFFSSDWSPAAGGDGSLIEPGHQFEWAWLLARYARARADAQTLEVAWRLFEAGLKGVDPSRGVAIDAMDIDGSIRSARARLWPQTEWLKASLVLASSSDDGRRDLCLIQAAKAQRALWRYLTPFGLWRDKMLESGDFIDEPAPASSLYHIMAAYSQVRATLGGLRPDLASSLDL